MATGIESLAQDRAALTVIQDHATAAALPLARELSADLRARPEVARWLDQVAGALHLLDSPEHDPGGIVEGRPPRPDSPVVRDARQALTEAAREWDGQLDDEQLRLRAFRLGPDFMSAWLEPVLDIAEREEGGFIWGDLLPVDEAPAADVAEVFALIGTKHAVRPDQIADYLRRFKQQLFGNRDHAELPGEAGMLKTVPGNDALGHKIFVASEELIRSRRQEPSDELARCLAEFVVGHLPEVPRMHAQLHVGLVSLSQPGALPPPVAGTAFGSKAAFSYLLACAESRLLDDAPAVSFGNGVVMSYPNTDRHRAFGPVRRIDGPFEVRIQGGVNTEGLPIDARVVGVPEVTRAFSAGMVTWCDAAKEFD